MVKVNLYDISPEELIKAFRESLTPYFEEIIEKSTKTKYSAKDLLTRDETAEFFSISKVTLHEWVKKKTLNPIRLHGRVYFRYSEILETLEKSYCRG